MAEGKRTDVIALFDVDGTLTEPRKVWGTSGPAALGARHVAAASRGKVTLPAASRRPRWPHPRWSSSSSISASTSWSALWAGRISPSRRSSSAPTVSWTRSPCAPRPRLTRRPAPVVNEVNYSFSENGLVAYRDGKLIHNKVEGRLAASPAAGSLTSRARPPRRRVRRPSRITWATSGSTSSSTLRCATSRRWNCPSNGGSCSPPLSHSLAQGRDHSLRYTRFHRNAPHFGPLAARSSSSGPA